MTSENLKYECLRLATLAGLSGDDALTTADVLVRVIEEKLAVKPARARLFGGGYKESDAVEFGDPVAQEAVNNLGRLIDDQINANARTGNEPLSGTENGLQHDEQGRPIPAARVIGRNGDADLAARLGMTDKLRNPLEFDDYKPDSD